MQDQPPCSPDGRPYLPEDRRLKIAGLIVLAVALASFGLLSQRTQDPHWLQSGVAALWPLALIAVLAINGVAAGALLLAAGFGQRDLWRDARGRRAASLKLLGVNVGLPAIGLSMLQDDQAFAALVLTEGTQAALGGMALLSIWACASVLRRGWQVEADSADEIRRRDARAPVIYLRSFADDGQALPMPALQRWMTPLLKVTSLTRVEQELAFILRRIGPVVAIGKPGEPLPELGAARMYVAHDRWQQVVTQWMREAALVVLQVGASAGIRWEIERSLAEVPRQRLVFVLLGDSSTLGGAAAWLGEQIGTTVPLPAAPAARWRRWVGALASLPTGQLGTVVCFDADGTPRIEPVRRIARKGADFAIGLLARPAAGPMRDAFRRVFAHLHRPWHQQRRRSIALALAWLLGGFGAHWWYLDNRRRALAYAATFVLFVPILLAWIDATRWTLIERRDFDRRFAAVA